MTSRLPSPLPFILIALALIAALFALTACETTDARRAGRVTTGAALIAFDSPEDAAVFERAKERIDAYLATGQPINDAVVNLFVDWLAAELGRNPGAVRLVVSELRVWIQKGDGLEPGRIEPAREFIQGVSDALGIAYPSYSRLGNLSPLSTANLSSAGETGGQPCANHSSQIRKRYSARDQLSRSARLSMISRRGTGAVKDTMSFPDFARGIGCKTGLKLA